MVTMEIFHVSEALFNLTFCNNFKMELDLFKLYLYRIRVILCLLQVVSKQML